MFRPLTATPPGPGGHVTCLWDSRELMRSDLYTEQNTTRALCGVTALEKYPSVSVPVFVLLEVQQDCEIACSLLVTINS